MMPPNEEPERTAPFPGPNARPIREPYKFSPEELKVLRECNTESFYQRCLPFGTVLGAATYYAVKTDAASEQMSLSDTSKSPCLGSVGTLAANKQFGAFPKVSVAVVIGFFLGKLSYQKKCAEKFMALPNSKFGHLIRARKSGFYDDQDPNAVPSIPLSPFGGMTDSYSDIEPPRNYDYDSRPSQEGLDDSFRPSMDNPIILNEQEMPPEQKHVTSYDELRKKNREEYEQKRLSVYKQTRLPKTPTNQPPPPTTSGTEFVDEPRKPPSTADKNQYGDIWG